jgi:menaquinone reductase, multiheme cytochrome c subunit
MEKTSTSSEKPSMSLVEALPPLERYASKGGWICFLAGFAGALILGWTIFPLLLYSSQPQPVDFNHTAHMESGIEACTDCHEFRSDGTFVGIPKLAKCMECHEDAESPLGDSKVEASFLETYVAEEKEVPWLSYSRQPDCVYFSHVAHVKMAELECKTCHGPHGETSTLPPYQKNRITGYPIGIWGKNISGLKKNTWDRMKMDDCAECHSQKGHEENNACFVCHK